MAIFSGKAEKYCNERVQKYVHSKENVQRTQEILTSVQNPNHLQLIICDEAHFSATSQTDQDKRETPYSTLLASWNSTQFPNVIVLLVSATPWNMLTVQTKLENIEIPDPSNPKRVVRLNVCSWEDGQEGDFMQGKEMRLLVMKYSVSIFARNLANLLSNLTI